MPPTTKAPDAKAPDFLVRDMTVAQRRGLERKVAKSRRSLNAEVLTAIDAWIKK